MLLAWAACSAAQPPGGEFQQAVLLDVQGLWGGMDLWISADGQAACRFVSPPRDGESGLQEIRYEFRLSDAQRAEWAGLIAKHSFFSLRTKVRQGYPDEARPCMYIQAGGQRRAVAKWASDTHKKFDPLYAFLRALAAGGRAGRLTWKGPYERNWRPEGFPESRAIRAGIFDRETD